MNRPSKPPRRRIDGVLLLDKPAGMTSNAALQKAKRLFNAAKAGHTGTLDPMATGLLPICFGEATKFAGELLAADKRYSAAVRLGVRTDTADAEGRITQVLPVSLTREQVEAALARFRGDILQVPPMHSALKRGSAGTLTLDDADALAELPNVEAVASVTNSFVQAVYQGTNTNTRLMGVTPGYEIVTSLTLEDGVFITEDDQKARKLVVVLGSSVAETLFGGTGGVVGQKVRLNGQPYEVIGVLASKGGTGFMNQDDQVFIPLSTALNRLVGGFHFRGSSVISQITVKASDSDVVDQVVNDVTLLMRERHETVEGADDFSVTSQESTLDAATEVADTMTAPRAPPHPKPVHDPIFVVSFSVVFGCADLPRHRTPRITSCAAGLA